MTESLLSTKLFIPPGRPEFVPRPRLIERLDAGLHCKLSLISAPAGFGKTTLVTEWLDNLCLDAKKENQVEKRIAWLSLDEDDNNLVRFLTYFIAALNQIEGIDATYGKGALSMLQSPQPPPTEVILTSLINDLAVTNVGIILVLDDYHLIETQSIHDALTFLLEHLPPEMHLVIATREDPHLPLARLRVKDQLTELRAVDLRFTPSEAAGFLNQVMGLNLSAEDIAALETRTEGWIAGLQLAAISMQGHKDTTSFIKSFTGSHHFVLDYLAEEVLHQQPETVQTFLLHTSILDRLCGPLCDAVLLDPSVSGQETLEYLKLANLFIIPLDDKRQWYRYHHLFADVLQAHSMKEQPNQLAALHLRASNWYEQNGLPSDAIHHALAAEDLERAAGLIELAWPVMDRSFQSATWLGWVKALPEEMVSTRPVLSVGYAWALLDGGELEAGEARLRDAERWLDNTADMSERSEVSTAGMVVVDEEQFRSLPVTIANARAFHAQALGDISGTVKYARRALDLLPEGDYIERGTPAALLGLTYLTSGDLEAAHRSFANVMASYKMVGKISLAISPTHILADIRMVQGRLHEAVNTYQQSLQLSTDQGEPVPWGTADLYLGLSVLHREQGNLEAARQHLLRSEELGEQAALPDWKYRVCLAQARTKEDQGDLDGALDLLDKAERLYYRSPLPDVRPVAALKAQMWVRQGRLTEALGWVREQELFIDDKLSYLREFEHITLVRVLIARYKNDLVDRYIHEAVELMERLLKEAKEGGRMGSVIEILVLQALAYEAQSSISPALVPLEHALTLAEPEDYVRIFVNEGIPMAKLLSEAATHGIMPDYISKLLTVFEAEQKNEDKSYRPAALPATPGQPLIEPLSQRELEVLQLIAQGLSNREISERLFLALSTVKGHNRKIFDKLQVQRRTEAVARARELNLL